jgi:hypothetical protein
VSLGWVISEEKFFKNINMDWFSYLKLRGSWGKLGNERIGAYDDNGNFIYNYYPYQAAIDYSTALFQNSQGIVSSVTTYEGHVAGTGNSTFHRLRQPGSQCRKYAHYRL